MNCIHKVIFLLVPLFIFVSSCELESNLPEPEVGKFVSQRLNDATEIARLKSFFVKSEGRIEEGSYNWDETTRVVVEGSEVTVFAVPEVSDEKNILGIYEMPEGTMSAIKLKVTSNGGIAKLNYLTLDNEPLLTVIADSNTEKFSYIYPSHNGGRIECGQATIDCVVDSYENLGWASVGLFIATLVQPQVGAAVAALCAVEECIFS